MNAILFRATISFESLCALHGVESAVRASLGVEDCLLVPAKCRGQRDYRTSELIALVRAAVPWKGRRDQLAATSGGLIKVGRLLYLIGIPLGAWP